MCYQIASRVGDHDYFFIAFRRTLRGKNCKDITNWQLRLVVVCPSISCLKPNFHLAAADLNIILSICWIANQSKESIWRFSEKSSVVRLRSSLDNHQQQEVFIPVHVRGDYDGMSVGKKLFSLQSFHYIKAIHCNQHYFLQSCCNERKQCEPPEKKKRKNSNKKKQQKKKNHKERSKKEQKNC